MASIQGLIDGKPSQIYLDTCSEINCVSKVVFDNMSNVFLQPSLYSLQNANGTPLRSHGSASLTLNIGGREWTETFMVANDLGVDILIGQPTMLAQGLDIINSQQIVQVRDAEDNLCTVPFYNSKELRVKAPKVLLTQKGETLSGLLYSQLAVTLPPYAEMAVPVMLTSKDKAKAYEFTAYVDSIAASSTRVYVAKGALTISDGCTEVVLCNPSSLPQSIDQGQAIASYTSIDPEDYTISPFDERMNPERKVLMITEQIMKNLGMEGKKEFKDFPPDLNIEEAGTTLTETQLRELMKLLNQYKFLFTLEKDAKATNVDRSIAEHGIDLLPGTQPIAMAPYRTSPELRKVIKEQIIDMLAKGVIRESRSPWAAPVVLIPKKDGKMRFCIDYRKLNNVTKREMYALPRIDDTLDALGGAKFFTCLDLTWGYWQIKMRSTDVEKTAFVTHEGQYEWENMPFGLMNAPATFQRMMNNAFAGLTWHCCLVYLDDIIIYSNTFEDHLRDLALVFQRVDEHGLRMKPSKCFIACDKVQYLGHMLTPDGLRAAPSKLKAIHEWPIPRNVKEVQSFLGLCGYYRKLIKDFAKLEKPLRDLTCKGTVFYMGPLELGAFDKLKDALVSDPVVKLPDFSGKYPFEVHTDACDTGVGAVLVQHDENGVERAVAYDSKNFNATQKKWHTTEHEAYAIVWSLEKFRPYLLGSHFILKTDHHSLQWLSKAPKGRLARWAMALSEYDFSIKHRSGKANANGDALSRILWPDDRTSDGDDVYARMQEISDQDTFLSLKKGARTDSKETAVVQIISMEPVLSTFRVHALSTDSALIERVLEAQRNNSAIAKASKLVKEDRLEDAMKALMSAPAGERVFFRTPRQAQLTTVSQVLCLAREARYLVIIPHNALDLKKELLEKTHDHEMAGHFGAKKTTHKIVQHYFWPNINADVKKYVKSCHQCQARKTPVPMKATLTPTIIEAANKLVGIDLIGPLNSPDGTQYTYVLVMIDYFTKWVNAVPLVNKEAATVAEGIFQGWYLQYGLPVAIHTDQGSEFTNDLLKHLNKRAGVDSQFTTPYNPAANGEVERVNRTLIDCLSCYVQDNPSLWHKHLNGVLFAYRTSVHSATGYTPFYLMYGHEARSPIDILNSSLKDIYHDVNNYSTLLTREIKRAHDIVKTRLLENAKRMKGAWDKSHRRRVATFSPGDKVLMFKPNLNKETGHPDHSAKFNRTWMGPYVVKEQRFEKDSDVYLLEDTSTRRQWSVNVNKLTKYFPRTFLRGITDDIQATTVGELDDAGGDRGGVDSVEVLHPMCKEVVTPSLGGPSSTETLVGLETVIPTAKQDTPVDFGVTRSIPTPPVSHEVINRSSRSDRTRVTNQERAREVKRQKLAEDSACDYAARLTSHEFKKVLNHGKAGNRFYYVVEWADPHYEPSRVWCSDVETLEAVEEYWKGIPKGSRPRMFRKYAFVASMTVDSAGHTGDGPGRDFRSHRILDQRTSTDTHNSPGTRKGLRLRVHKHKQ
jgi:hypothetical protein